MLQTKFERKITKIRIQARNDVDFQLPIYAQMLQAIQMIHAWALLKANLISTSLVFFPIQRQTCSPLSSIMTSSSARSSYQSTIQSQPYSINFTINDRSDSNFEHRYALLVQTTWDQENNPPVLAKVPMYPNQVSIEKQQI